MFTAAGPCLRPDAHWLTIAHEGKTAAIHRGMGTKKETCSTSARPIGKFVGQRRDFVAHVLDAVDPACRVIFNQPVPESGTRVEPVVQIPGGDERVGVEQVRNQNLIPSS